LEEEEQEIRKVKEENAALARTLEDAMKQLEQESRKVKNENVALAGALFFVMHLNAH
jgi:flagellar motility protein MotE (MotC chaperone)